MLFSDLNRNDTIVAKSSPIVVSTEYSSLLTVINANRTTHGYPFSIQKFSTTSYSDLPTNFGATNEFTAFVFGSDRRATCILKRFNSNGHETYERDVFDGAWLNSWRQLESAPTVGDNYIQLANGLKICWGTINFTTVESDWTAFGNWYYVRKTINMSFPVTFNTNVCVQMTTTSPDTPHSGIQNTLSGINYVDFVRPTRIASEVWAYYFAIGY